ncbi:hypothetical protein [Halocatena halophila]|uniref:hypothetical protein n=1 Tax=Halocatena halophila TaxID=2814576 RepID=UPI002ED4AAE3
MVLAVTATSLTSAVGLQLRSLPSEIGILAPLWIIGQGIVLLLVSVLLAKGFPSRTEQSLEAIRTRPFQQLIWGVVVGVLVAFGFLFVFSMVLAPLAFVLALAYLLFIYLPGLALIALLVGTTLTSGESSDISTAIVGSVVIVIVGAIPVVGLIVVVGVLFGIGAWIRSMVS